MYWFILISLGICYYSILPLGISPFLSVLKVSTAEAAGFIAAIVYNNKSNDLIEMTDPCK